MKVGDKVRIVNENTSFRNYEAKVLEVIDNSDITLGVRVELTNGGRPWQHTKMYFNERELEVISEPKPLTKEERTALFLEEYQKLCEKYSLYVSVCSMGDPVLYNVDGDLEEHLTELTKNGILV